MPPRRGGKSLDTSRTRLTRVRLADQPLLPAREQARRIGAEDVVRRGEQVGMSDTASGHVKLAQLRRPIGIGDEAGKPPRPVIRERALRTGSVEFGVQR